MVKEIITVKGVNVLKILYAAKGFRQAFFILVEKERKEHWSNQGDVLSVIATNGCFSLELYFKFLIVLASYKEDEDKGTHKKKHTFKDLYSELSNVDETNTYIKDLEELYRKLNYKNGCQTLNEYLCSINDYFQQWRYSYDFGNMKLYLNTLTEVLNMMDKYSTEKWIEKASKLGHSEIISKDKLPQIIYDNQMLIIDDFNSIKEEDN